MTEFVESVRSQVVGQLASGVATGDVLAGLCLSFESNMPGTKAGVTILDRTLQTFEHAIFPSLSPDYAQALKGIAVADKPGSCALAVHEGRTVVSTDVATDSRFTAIWRDLGTDHGLEALVSIPAKDGHGQSLGTFVVAYPPKAGLNRDDLKRADDFAELCAYVLAHRRNHATRNPVVSLTTLSE